MMNRGAAIAEEFYKGQAVEVRRSHGGRDTWRAARIHRRTSSGYEVIYAEGPQAPQHIMRCDLRPTETRQPERPTVKVSTPLLSPADIDAYNARIEAEAKARSAAAVANTPEPAPAPAQTLVLVRRNAENGMVRTKRQPKVHNPTPLALALRNARVAKGMQQSTVATLAKLRHSSRLSPLEFGDSLPNDDELLNLSIVLDLDLGHLLELREQGRDPERASRIVEAPRLASAPPPPALPAPEPAPKPEPPRERPRELPPAALLELETLREENAILRGAIVFYAGLER